MVDDASTPPSIDEEQPDEPTERATLQIRCVPFSVTVSSQGAGAAAGLTLGVIGPPVTFAVGHYVGLPVWMISVVCVLQIAGAVVRTRK